jgi:hypothetical protein
MFAMACDQMFIGEDLLAAGAQVSENKILLSGLASEEIWKFVSIGLIIGGSLLQAVGIDIAGLLGM